MQLTTITGDPAAWKPSDIDLKNVVFEIQPAHVREIAAAVDAAAKKVKGGLDAPFSAFSDSIKSVADFELPTLGQELAAHVHERVEGGEGFAMVRGLAVEEWGEAATRVAVPQRALVGRTDDYASLDEGSADGAWCGSCGALGGISGTQRRRMVRGTCSMM
jgi:hypothetical protein